MSQFIDQIVIDAVHGKTLPETHRARVYAEELPYWHPVRNLLRGPSQWIGQIDAAFDLFAIFTWRFLPQLLTAAGNGFLSSKLAPPDPVAEIEAFKDLIPPDMLYQGQRFNLHALHAEARAAIEAMAERFPPICTEALADFDMAFALLVRVIRWS